MVKITFVGTGNIGETAYNRALLKGWEVPGIIEIDGVYKDPSKKQRLGDIDKHLDIIGEVDAAVLAIPGGDGRIPFEYICDFFSRGIPVATTEKGALANYYAEIEGMVREMFPRIPNADIGMMLGYSAAVGGGTMLLHMARRRITEATRQVYGVFNGTLNFTLRTIDDNRGKGVPMASLVSSVVEKAGNEGYAEPGQTEALPVINEEACGDVPKKSAIFFNRSGLADEYIQANDIECPPIEQSQLDFVLKEPGMRYIVHMYKKSAGITPHMRVGGFEHRTGDWCITAGFMDTRNHPVLSQLDLEEAGNAMLIDSGADGFYTLTGPGAGRPPTASAVIKDVEELVKAAPIRKEFMSIPVYGHAK